MVDGRLLAIGNIPSYVIGIFVLVLFTISIIVKTRDICTELKQGKRLYDGSIRKKINYLLLNTGAYCLVVYMIAM